jgi:hypothetical protein
LAIFALCLPILRAELGLWKSFSKRGKKFEKENKFSCTLKKSASFQEGAKKK